MVKKTKENLSQKIKTNMEELASLPTSKITKVKISKVVKIPKIKKSSTKKKKEPEITKLRLILQKDAEECKINIVDKTKIQNTETVVSNLIKRPQLQPVVHLPSRFPMVMPERWLTISHSIAVFFLLFGVTTATFNFSHGANKYSSVPVTNLASSIDGISSGTTNSTSTAVGTSSPNPSEIIDPKPVPTIFTGSTESLTESTSLSITVPYADEVKILLIDIEHNQTITLGNANNINNMTWKYEWDTRRFDNGSYKYKIIIRNQFGVYQYIHNAPIQISNIHEQSTGSVQNVSTSTDTLVDGQPSVIGNESDAAQIEFFVLESSPVTGQVPLKVLTEPSSDVKIYAKNTETLAFYYLGRALHVSDLEWKLIWDSVKVPNGKYQIGAKATKDNATFISQQKIVTVFNKSNLLLDGNIIKQATVTSSSTHLSSVEVVLSITEQDFLSDFTSITVDAPSAERVEIYAVRRNSNTPLFLGLAQKVKENHWKYLWSTTQSPNGDYDIYARAKIEYAYFESDKIPTRVLNQTSSAFSPDQEETIDSLTRVESSLTQEVDTSNSDALSDSFASSPSYIQPKVVYIQPVSVFVETMEVDDNDKAKIDSLLMEFRAVLLKKIESYASLIRTDNHDSATKVKGEIENLRDDFLQKLPDSLKKKELIDAINVYMSQVIFELTELAKNNEMILKERIGTEVFADDDKDGVSNYDEINLYKTNAFSADTDGDGFIDGAEITRGFDPHNSKKQANIAYESPKETGLVREDLLVVEKILSLSQSDDEEVKSQSQALISGRGLPNSFVTLYIFSTPIVVTVKTDEKGNWSYIFDKELEDGRHEIVAGITDNAGKIVAKSNPITFVKTAEAFEMQNTADQIATNVTAPTLTKSSTTLLVSSLLVIILGFVLIFLGMHVKKHQITQDKMTL